MPLLLDELDLAVDNGTLPPIEIEDDTPLNDKDRKWVENKIEDAIKTEIAGPIKELVDSLRPRGAKKMFFWLREWGILAANITVVIALLGLLATAIYAVTRRATDEATFEAKTDSRLTAIEKSLGSLKLASLAERPATAQTVQQIAEVIDSAKSAKQKLDPLTVSATGQSLARSATDNPSAWQAASLLVDYKTELNADSFPSIEGALPYYQVDMQAAYQGSPDWVGHLSFLGHVSSPQESADIRPIDSEPLSWPPSKPLPKYMVLQGGTFDIDGEMMRNVIIINATIRYRGAPVRLDHVYFVNCSFDMRPEKNTLQLADAILAPDTATSIALGS